jgi:hypothetical protein
VPGIKGLERFTDSTDRSVITLNFGCSARSIGRVAVIGDDRSYAKSKKSSSRDPEDAKSLNAHLVEPSKK